MDRRKFLQSSAIAGSALYAGSRMPSIAKPVYRKQESFDFMDNDNIMIIVELFGGNDGLNTIIPVEVDRYYEYRPNIAITKADAARWQNSNLYFHPALVVNEETGGFMGMMDNGQLAVVENVGYENPTLSHFRSAEIWQSGINSKDPKVKLDEGWLGRYIANKLPDYPLVLPEHPVCISVGGTVPLLFKSRKGHMGIAVNDAGTFAEKSAGLKPNFPMLDGSGYFPGEFNFTYNIASQSEQYGKAVTDAYNAGSNTIAYTDTRLGKKFATIAKLISGGLKTKVFYVGLSNFDSHVQQMGDPLSGQHPILLAELSNAISEFMRDAAVQGFAERVAGMTTSEFGRRVKDNGSRGTDHGTASTMFVFGHYDYMSGAVYGDIPNLDDLDRGNLKHQFDFRMIYADFLEKWFGATDEEIDDLFQENIGTLNILKTRKSSVQEDILRTANPTGVLIYPNPSSGQFTASLQIPRPMDMRVSLYTESGMRLFDLFTGLAPAGELKLPVTLTTPGRYFVSFKVGSTRVTGKVLVR